MKCFELNEFLGKKIGTGRITEELEEFTKLSID
jgi:hypothetical protein